ncbi:hypothetical protein HU200_052358 [Digitaria exilis]|uniref:Uncharacterized protein n=1 Tax=Digitaria exilis TaxID=1010633 RepID=A0A835E8R3_9POAL|nr:hypothetical protein HU200_052358 [Digitaria exilis]
MGRDDLGNEHEFGGLVFGLASTEKTKELWFKKVLILLKIQRLVVATTISLSLIRRSRAVKMVAAVTTYQWRHTPLATPFLLNRSVQIQWMPLRSSQWLLLLTTSHWTTLKDWRGWKLRSSQWIVLKDGTGWKLFRGRTLLGMPNHWKKKHMLATLNRRNNKTMVLTTSFTRLEIVCAIILSEWWKLELKS